MKTHATTIWRTGTRRATVLPVLWFTSMGTVLACGCGDPARTPPNRQQGARGNLGGIADLPGEAINEIIDPTGVRRGSKEAERAYSRIADAVQALDVDEINATIQSAREYIASLNRVNVSQTVARVDDAIEAIQAKFEQLDVAAFNRYLEALQSTLQAKAGELDIAAANRTVEALEAKTRELDIATANRTLVAIEQKVAALDTAAFNEAIKALRAKIDEIDVVGVQRTATGFEGVLATTGSAARIALWSTAAAAILATVFFGVQIYRMLRAKRP